MIPALHLSPRFLLGSFGALLGFACVRLVGFRPFGPLALVQQALLAIFLAALRRFGGPALFHGLRTSPLQGASFWPSGLTLRSSGPAFCGPLTLAVSHEDQPNSLVRKKASCSLLGHSIRCSRGALHRVARHPRRAPGSDAGFGHRAIRGSSTVGCRACVGSGAAT